MPLPKKEADPPKRPLPTFCVMGPHFLKRIRSHGSSSAEGIPMLQLYFAAFGAVVAANIIVVIAMAATIKRDRSRFWPLWLWPNVPK